PTGGFPGAVPSQPDVRARSDESLSVPVTVGRDGGVARVGLLRIAPAQVPKEARQATDPVPRPGMVTGVVWRDVKPGADVKGKVERGELGLPGVHVVLRDASGHRVGSDTTGDNGSFRIEGVGAGAYAVRVPGSTFRPPWKGISWL